MELSTSTPTLLIDMDIAEATRIDVKTIFTEEMASPAVSQTLANEVGAGVETIYTIEGNEDNMTYLERMTDNPAKIYKSLAK